MRVCLHLALSLLAAASAAAEVAVRAIHPAFDGKTNSVVVARYGGDPRAEVAIGLELAPLDRLRSLSGDVVVEIDCNGNAVVLSRDFDVAIDPNAAGGLCGIDLRGGEADLRDRADTRFGALEGTVVGGSQGTQYAVRVAADKSSVRVLVFDGKVRVEEPGSRKLKAGQQVRATPRRLAGPPRDLTLGDALPSAESYARANAGRAALTGHDPQVVLDRMRGLHLAVLRTPKNVDARRALTEALEDLSLYEEADYHRQRLRRIRRARIGKSVAALVGAVAVGLAVDELTEEERPKGEAEGPAQRRPEPLGECDSLRRAANGRVVTEVARHSEARLRAGEGLSCHYYQVARWACADRSVDRTYDALEAVYAYCERALDAHRRDGQLSPGELDFCRQPAPCPG